MRLSPVLSPSGEPMFSAGGGEAYKVAVKHGYVISLEWVNLGKHIRAAMCIWPASNVFVTGEGQGIWTITRNCISEFVGFNKDDKCTGGASEHCFREAKLAMPPRPTRSGPMARPMPRGSPTSSGIRSAA